MNEYNKLHSNRAIRGFFFSMTGIGISANGVLLFFHVLRYIHGHRPKLTNLLITFLVFIHLMLLLNVSVTAIDIFIHRTGWNDVTCKCVFYLLRLFRGLSLCTACMLSVLQAITLSPRSSCLAQFKYKSPRHKLWSFFFLCVFYISINSQILMSVASTNNLTSGHFMYASESCSLFLLSYPVRQTFSTLVALRDVFLIGLMVLSSGYMAALLLRHKKQSQHLQSTCPSLRVTPEQRATRTILLLMSLFVVLCVIDCIVSYSRAVSKGNPVLYCVQILVVHNYATLSPFVVISNEKRLISFVRAVWERAGHSRFTIKGRFP